MYWIIDRQYLSIDNNVHVYVKDIVAFKLGFEDSMRRGRLMPNEPRRRRIFIWLSNTPKSDPWTLTEGERDFQHFLTMIDDNYEFLFQQYVDGPKDINENRQIKKLMAEYEDFMFGLGPKPEGKGID
jgi:hypothetical protein